MAQGSRYILVLLSAISISIMLGVWWSNDIVLVTRRDVLQPPPLQEDMEARDLMTSAPDESETVQHHPLCPHRKRRHFPHFSYPPATPRNWIRHIDTTNSTFTRYSVVNPRESYSVCDELELLIEARNGYDEPKMYGGDLLRAKIFTKNESFSAGSGTDGEVVDHGNGKYSAFFTLKWTGIVRINVTLVAPSEAVFELHNLRETLQPRENYEGKFSKRLGGRDVEEIVLCNHVPVDRLSSTCNLSDDTVGLTWYCQKPKSPFLSCADWTAFISKWNNRITSDLAISKRSSVVHRAPVPIMGFPNHVTVGSHSDDFTKRLHRLPICGQQPDRVQVIPWVAGFYENGRWLPPSCKVKVFPETGIKRSMCLANKSIYFYGDSTIRQVYFKLVGPILGSRFQIVPNKWMETDDRYDFEDDIHLHFGFHHAPIRHFVWHNLTTLRFIAREVDNISSDETAIVVVCLWAHFQPLSKSLYLQRIRSIAVAAQRLLDRNPKATVVFKGANTQTPYAEGVQYLNDYYARDNEEALRRILTSYPKFHFLDAWDMSKGQLALADVHPPQPHVSNLIDQILTIVCPDFV